ncbi:hypothetical protein [Thalassovita taeanensis]|uniref:Translocase n=1 Tax=Thalassovita taeanensis TaxID=657014 RepID=A0A1H9JMN7_9RHOB|nr:hypothetical protein [Thalassovita taeanensis]SEQ88112.1 hypothetical protein SAMN04488092_11590 [Thalassovita taeanensis]
MSLSNRFFLTCGSVSMAIAIGYVMQSSVEPDPRTIAAVPMTPAPIATPDVASPMQLTEVAHTSALPVPPEEARAALDLPSMPVRTVAASAPTMQPLAQDQSQPEFGAVCEPEMTARPSVAGMVRLDIAADCLANARVTIHHNSMMFSTVTGVDGTRTLTVPALSEQAVFIADFGNGMGAVAHTEVASLAYYDRVVVQWAGDSGLHLHAMEYGAQYGEKGHIWFEHTGSAEEAAHGAGGFLTRLGDPELEGGLRAEVYTFPSGTAARAGDVDLQVEAEVNTQNCGRDVSAQAMQLNDDGTMQVQDVELSMPDCDAVGDFLVLKNLLQDLKIASN